MASFKLIRSRSYRNALENEYDYIARSNPSAAEAVVQRIEHAAARLRDFPHSGTGWRRPGIRELVVAGLPYIVIYRVRGDAVELLAIFHASQEPPHAR